MVITRYLCGDRQTGKTQHVIEWFAEAPYNRVILAADNQRRLAIVDRLMADDSPLDPQAKTLLNLAADHVYVWGESWRQHARLRHVHRPDLPLEIALDEFPDFLYRTLGAVPSLVTGSMPMLMEFIVIPNDRRY